MAKNKPMSKEEFLANGGLEWAAGQEQNEQQMIDKQMEMQQMAEKMSAYEESEGGRIGKIGVEQIRKATKILQDYKDGKTNLEARVIEAEEFWKLRHWNIIKEKEVNKDPEPVSAWLFNSLANKHADAEDNYPEPNVLAREQSDKADAKMLSEILPVVLEQADFGKTYSYNWWRKLITGTAVYSVLWDSNKRFGMGDIAIGKISMLNIFFQPGISDIQESKNVFTVELRDNDTLKQEYPFLEKLGKGNIDVSKYRYDDAVDTKDKSLVVDWYYKKRSEANPSIELVHYVKFVNEDVLYASENDPMYADRGFYDHGKYPFVFDVMFPEEGTPAGFGYVDIMKSSQIYIDKMQQNILKSSLMATKPRYFIKQSGDVNEEEFADFNKPFVHVTGANLGDDSIKQITVDSFDKAYITVLNNKIDELKETSGNRDFSQGSTTSGVTAASAIAALQEAGSKLSRDMIKQSYMAYEDICYMCIELIRQFYDEPREFRIVGEYGAVDYMKYSNANIKPQSQGDIFGVDMGYRVPIFDIKITAAKASTFSKISQNELAKELYGAGFFNPQMCDQVMIALDMMDFEGKDMVEQKVAQNGMLQQQVQMLQQTILKLASTIDAQNGSNLAESLASGMSGGEPMPGGQMGGSTSTDPLGAAVERTGSTTADKAKERAMNVASPK